MFQPLRYIYSPTAGTYSGNVTILDSHPQGTFTAADACLDEVSTQNQVISGNFQITLIFTNLPPGVKLLNATGKTASGHPYITSPTKVPFGPGKSYRVAVVFSDPLRVPISTFLEGPATDVFAGPFNPANH